jgi:hypothetical protein
MIRTLPWLALLALALAALAVPACGDDGGNGGAGGTADGGSGGSGGSGGTGGGGGSGGHGQGGTGGLGGSGGEALACESFAPCGGDPVGNWRATESCFLPGSVDIAVADPACAGIPTTISATVTGSATYTATEETLELAWTGTETFTIPPACLAALEDEFGIGCVDIRDDPACTCTDAGGACDCSCDVADGLTGPIGYVVTGSSIVYEDGGGEVPFCVRGDRMAQVWNGFRLILERQP